MRASILKRARDERSGRSCLPSLRERSNRIELGFKTSLVLQAGSVVETVARDCDASPEDELADHPFLKMTRYHHQSSISKRPL